MGKSIPKREEKRRAGRPATGKMPMASLRLPDALAVQIDAWALAQADGPGRSEAIRRLIELGLKAKK
jgi:metal-responsive CopG/Arc/MetJ family transcriptional regulator